MMREIAIWTVLRAVFLVLAISAGLVGVGPAAAALACVTAIHAHAAMSRREP